MSYESHSKLKAQLLVVDAYSSLELHDQSKKSNLAICFYIKINQNE
jgi:hypothetical protein